VGYPETLPSTTTGDVWGAILNAAVGNIDSRLHTAETTVAALPTTSTTNALSSRISALESLNVNAQTSSYTLVLADANDVILAGTGTTAYTLTIPTNASVAFPIGTTITVIAKTTALTITAASGVTPNYYSPTGVTGQSVTARALNAWITLFKSGTNTWEIGGAIT
jgi:hypothetical protein